MFPPGAEGPRRARWGASAGTGRAKRGDSLGHRMSNSESSIEREPNLMPHNPQHKGFDCNDFPKICRIEAPRSRRPR